MIFPGCFIRLFFILLVRDVFLPALGFWRLQGDRTRDPGWWDGQQFINHMYSQSQGEGHRAPYGATWGLHWGQSQSAQATRGRLYCATWMGYLVSVGGRGWLVWVTVSWRGSQTPQVEDEIGVPAGWGVFPVGWWAHLVRAREFSVRSLGPCNVHAVKEALEVSGLAIRWPNHSFWKFISSFMVLIHPLKSGTWRGLALQLLAGNFAILTDSLN